MRKILIKGLLENISMDNYKIVMSLIYNIDYDKISSIEELKLNEDRMFTINNKILSDDEKIKRCLEILSYSISKWDNLDFGEIQVYENLMLEIKSTDDFEFKVKNLAKIFALVEFDLPFPYLVYNMIVDKKI